MVSASAPLAFASGALSIDTASAADAGVLSAADWQAFNAKISTSDPRLSDPRAPLPGSSFYIQNGPSGPQNASINLSGNATIGGNLSFAGTLTGDGSHLTGVPSLSAANVNFTGAVSAGSIGSSGSVAAASFSGDGSSVTNLNANNIGSGTVSSSHLPLDVAYYDALTPQFSNALSAASFSTSGGLTVSGTGGVTISGSGGFSGDGSALLNLPASQLTGSVGLSHLPVASSGTSSTTALVRADDSRLSDARAAASVNFSSASLSGSVPMGNLPVASSGSSSSTALVRADDSRLSDARAASSVNFGSASLSGAVPIGNLPVASSGSSSTTALVRADDSRLSDARAAASVNFSSASLSGTLPDTALSTNVATKSYVTSAVQSAPPPTGQMRKYVVVLATRNGCPSGWTSAGNTTTTGWTEERFSDLVGTSNAVYTVISGAGLAIGGVAASGNVPTYDQEHIYARNDSTSGIARYCWREFTTRGKPMTALLAMPTGNTCPSDYQALDLTNLQRSDGYVHMMANGNGFWLGGLSDYSYSNSGSNNTHGFLWRYWSTQIGVMCLRIMGVEDDPATREGVLPMMIGLKPGQSSFTCPAGWDFKTMAQTANPDGASTLIQFTDNAMVMGAWEGNDYGGQEYLYVYQNGSSYADDHCWKFLPLSGGSSFVHTRMVNSNVCGSGAYAGYLGVPLTAMSQIATGPYLMRSDTALYAGNLYTWYGQGYNYGTMRWYLDGANTMCIKPDNVASYP